MATSADAETLYKQATRLELDGQFDRAFQLYVKSVEGHMRLSQLSKDAAVRDMHKAQAAKALDRAERIKQKKGNLITPVVKDHFAEGEQLRVLHHSSVINGIRYPIWSDPTISVPVVDISSPKLSPEQVEHEAIWQEPPPQDYKLYDPSNPPRAEDIVQHVVPDCSLCAAVAVCIDHDRRFGSKLVRSALYPQNMDGLSTVSFPKSRSLRVLFNGTYRKANIDATLPSYQVGTLMCMSAGSKKELWPSYIEKAYMKLMGGYDFPGSLSTTDLHALTGWIPETIEISSSTFERERTGMRLPEETLLPLPLLPAHCYAVIDVREEGDERLVTILDSWVEDTQERNVQGLSSSLATMSLDNSTQRERKDQSSKRCTVSWDTICTVFDVLLVNWDPSIFRTQLAFHGIWMKDASADESLPRDFHLRLSVKSNEEADVWILLTRHLTDTKNRQDEYISLDVQDEDEAGVTGPGQLGAYANNTHFLVKHRCRTSILAIAASYDGPYTNVGFTITAYSSVSIQWAGCPPTLPYSEKTPGALTNGNAGGNASSPTFMINPQYSLRIHPGNTEKASGMAKSRLSVALTGNRHVPFNVSIVWSQGQRVTDMGRSDIALTTGAYKYGHASVSKALPPGEYTIIVSAFEPGQRGPYNLKIDCSTRFELASIPQEGSGMFTQIARGSWSDETAGGGPSFDKYKSNPIYELKLPTQSHVKVRLRLAASHSPIALNVTVFRNGPGRTLGAHVATSGPYADAVCGVVTPQVSLQPGSYYIIPSTYNPGVKAGFRLLAHTSASRASLELVQLEG